MKYILLLVVLFCSSVKAQTVIPATTTIDSVNKLNAGTKYRFFTIQNKDTVDFTLDVKVPCPVCPVCPTCPPATKRNLVKLVINRNAGTATATYSDGLTSTLTLTNNITIQ